MAAVMPLEMLNRQLEINSCLSRTEISARESVRGCESVDENGYNIQRKEHGAPRQALINTDM